MTLKDDVILFGKEIPSRLRCLLLGVSTVGTSKVVEGRFFFLELIKSAPNNASILNVNETHSTFYSTLLMILD